MKTKDPRNRAKPSTTVTVRPKPPAVAMDPTVWSRLPEELLELVLSFLPLKAFFNLRSTCKRFNSLVFSPSFASKHSSSSSPKTTPFSSFLLLSHPQLHRHLALYDSDLATWRNLSVSSPSPSPSTLVSSSDGLLCFSLPNTSSFMVCNVLAKSSRAVRFPFHPFSFDSLSLASTPTAGGGYTILALSASNQAFLYSSETRSWTRPGSFDPILNGSGVFFKGRFYYTTTEPFSVVCFDLASASWARLGCELPDDMTFARLVSSGDEGRLLVVGGVGRNGIARSLRVWELLEGGEGEGEGETRWVEMERVPELMCQKLMSVCYHNYQHVYCFWHRGMLCVCCYNWPEILYYKSSRRTWHWLPKCPSLPDKWSCGFRWFSFVPELYALV